MSVPPDVESIRREFVRVLPRIETHAAIVFRAVRCPATRADYIAESVALSWKWFRRLRLAGGKDPREFVSALATFAARAARNGRRLCGQDRAGEVLSPQAQAGKGFAVVSLPLFSTLNGNEVAEALADHRRTPVDEQVAFHLDFRAWLSALGARHRLMAEAMARGERTQDLARLFGVSPARVSQLRREFAEHWISFTALDKENGRDRRTA
jgi:hypothetical protein